MSLPTVSQAYAVRQARRTRVAHVGKALLGLALVALVLSLTPQLASAQVIRTTGIATQFWGVFKTIRQIVVGLALLYTFIEGLKAIKGDSEAWKKVISGFVVIVVMLYPGYILTTFFGVSDANIGVQDGGSSLFQDVQTGG